MRLVRIEIDLLPFTFVCETKNTHYGFIHVCRLFEFDNCYNELEKATATYYNRTWEKYRYQTVMLAAVQKRIDHAIADKKSRFMLVNNIKRLSGANKERFEKLVQENGYINKLHKLQADLRENCY